MGARPAAAAAFVLLAVLCVAVTGAAAAGGHTRDQVPDEFAPGSTLLSKSARRERFGAQVAQPTEEGVSMGGWDRIARMAGVHTPAAAAATAYQRMLVKMGITEAVFDVPRHLNAVGNVFRTLAGIETTTPASQRRQVPRRAHLEQRAAAELRAAPAHYRALHGIADDDNQAKELPSSHGMEAVATAAATSVADSPAARRLSLSCGAGRAVTVIEPTYFCNGVQVPQAQYDLIIAAQETGANVTTPTNATVTVGNATISVDLPAIPALNATCNITQTAVERCACPMDYYGDNCQSTRRVECSLAMAEDSVQACMDSNAAAWRADTFVNQYDSALDGSPPCLVLSESTTVAFRLTCGFTEAYVPMCNGSVIENATSADGPPPFYGLQGCAEEGFSYWVAPADTNNVFAISTAPTTAMELSVQPVDFNRLQMVGTQLVAPVPREAIIGTATPSVTVAKSSIPDHAWAGGRTTLSAQATGGTGASVAINVLPHLVTADQAAYSPPPPEDTVDVALIVVVCLCVVLAIAAAVAVYWRFGRSRPSPEELAQRKRRGGGYKVKEM